MSFGLENLFNPPFSLILSIILSLGVVFIGQNFNKILLVKIMNYKYKNYFIFFYYFRHIYSYFFMLLLILLDILSIFVFKSISFYFCLRNIKLFIFIKFLKKKLKFNLLNLYSSKKIISIYYINFFIFVSVTNYACRLLKLSCCWGN